jgi:hypothetical protein
MHAFLFLSPALLLAAPDLTTTAQRTQHLQTGRYDEVVRLCAGYERAYPGKVRCVTFGTTPEGRPMLALVASTGGVLDAAAARKKGVPVVLFQGGIHAGEIDGKDAGFELLSDLLQGKAGAGLLNKVTAVFVPVFNVDGHERFGPNNRPNQVGPAEMGWRTSAQNLNINRDYVKADTPEMVAMLGLLHGWDPILYVDLHVTDGADFQPDVSVMLEPLHVGPSPLRVVGKRLLDGVVADLRAHHHVPLTFYPSFISDDDPSSGFAQGVAPPRFSQGYWSTNQRLGVLVETHSWKPYAVRVKATYDTVLSLLEHVALDAGAMLAAAREADALATSLPGTRVALSYDHGKTATTLPFPGYEYRREPSAISGGLMTTYDNTRPTTWNIPFFPDVVPLLEVDAPAAGYVVPVAYAARVKEKLRVHAIAFTELAGPVTTRAQAFHIQQKTYRPESYEGHHTVTVKGAWSVEEHTFPKGSLYVPLNQRGGLLAMHLLEPTAPDSLMAWGFFNAVLEQKEYLEPYVAEKVAREMLARDPALQAEFNRKLAEDAAFARDPEARLDFFYRRHPSYDRAFNVYPVARVDQAPR